MLERRCYTIDIDPIYCEIAIRRIEHFRATGKTGWRNGNPFEKEILANNELRTLLTPEEVEDEQLVMFDAVRPQKLDKNYASL